MSRRPIKTRSAGWARTLAKWLAQSRISANQISMLSVVMAALAGGAFYIGGFWLLAAALFMQLRLLCNLLDGMVAVEGGKSAPDGPFWNEFPDRISDIMIFVGLGYGLDLPSLGWAAATLALLTAYLRELGCNVGLPADFSGPMAKPHRMALLTIAAILAAMGFSTLELALWGLIIGSAFTALRRSYRIVQELKRLPKK